MRLPFSDLRIKPSGVPKNRPKRAACIRRAARARSVTVHQPLAPSYSGLPINVWYSYNG